MRPCFLCLISLCLSHSVFSQEIWQGARIEFVKANNTDPSLEANQDRITDNVWITRGQNRGIYNAKSETLYTEDVSPEGTEWSFGTTADIEELTFKSWEETNGSNPPSTVGEDMVLHLVDDDIYMDVKFISWSGGGQGGGFRYSRSTDGPPVPAPEPEPPAPPVEPEIPDEPEEPTNPVVGVLELDCVSKTTIFTSLSLRVAQITYESCFSGRLDAAVYDSNGRLVHQITEQVVMGLNEFTIHCPGCSSGYYFFVTEGKQNNTLKFVIP